MDFYEFATKYRNFMAQSKDDYENKLVNIVNGAIREYSKCTLAGKCDLQRWRGHWCREYMDLLGPNVFYSQLTALTKTKFDRDRVFSRILSHINFVLIPSAIEFAEGKIKSDNNLSKLTKKLTESDFNHFIELVKKKGNISQEDEYNFQKIPEHDRYYVSWDDRTYKYRFKNNNW